MDKILLDHRHLLEARQARPAKREKRLKVFYGWSKINKVQKKEAIAVFFENEVGAGSEPSRSSKTLKKLVDVVAERVQTEKEMQDASFCNRAFTVYYIFLDDKAVKGSLERALEINSQADKNHIPSTLRKEIEEKLRKRYLEVHPDYKEPIRQLEIEFEQ